MKQKNKLIASFCMLALVIFSLVTGVLAVTTLNFNIGGSIKFKAKGINATISAGTLSATGTHVTAADSTNKMKAITLSTTTEDPNHASNVASWAGLNLLFNENGDDVTISFSITNNAASSTTETIYSKITTSAGAGATNATIAVNTPTTEIAPQATKNFVITFHVTEPSLNAELPAFVITVELSLTSFDAASLSFEDYISGPSNTVSVGGFDNTLDSISIPSTVTKEGTNYTVTSIKSNAFADCTALKSVSIPQSVTMIEPNAFVGCSGLSSISFANEDNWYVTTSASSTVGTPLNVSNATANVESLKTLYAGKYIKRGEFTAPKVLTVVLDHPTLSETYYIPYEDGMTWQDLINNASLNQVTNAQNSLVGQICAELNQVGYIDSEHSFSYRGGPLAPADGTYVLATDLIDPDATYKMTREVTGAPYFVIKCGDVQSKVLTVVLDNSITQETYYIPYEDGITWQYLIESTFNVVTNAQNSLIGQICVENNHVGYTDAEHSFSYSGGILAPTYGDYVLATDLIDPNATYKMFREVPGAPYFIVKAW